MEYLAPTNTQQNAFSRMAENKISNLQQEAISPEKKSDEELKSLAQKFESIFVNLLLKEMRETVPKSDLMNSFSVDTYQSMFDEEVAAQISSTHKGVGLADVLYAQLSRLRENSGNEKQEDVKSAEGNQQQSFTLAQPKEIKK